MSDLKWPLMKDNLTLSDRVKMASFCLSSNRFTNGPKVRQFESKWSEWLGSKHSLYVSSGSTANYLLLSSVKELYGLKDGDKVLVPAGRKYLESILITVFPLESIPTSSRPEPSHLIFISK